MNLKVHLNGEFKDYKLMIISEMNLKVHPNGEFKDYPA